VGKDVGQEKVVVLAAGVPRIGVPAHPAHPRRGGRTVVAVGDVQVRDLAEDGGDVRDPAGVGDHPEPVFDAVGGSEVVLRLAAAGRLDSGVEVGPGVVGQEDRAGLGVELADVAGAVVLLVLPGQLVLADHVGVIVVHRRAGGQRGLNVIAHPLAVDVEAVGRIPEQHAVGDQALEVFLALMVDAIVVQIDAGGQVDLGLAHVEEGVGIAARHGQGLLR